MAARKALGMQEVASFLVSEIYKYTCVIINHLSINFNIFKDNKQNLPGVKTILAF